MATGSDARHGELMGEAGHIHVSPVKEYWLVFGALMVLLVITVGAAAVDVQKFIPIPGLNIMIALAIAIVKTSLVVWYFMHVKAGTKLTWIWAALGFVWLLIMFGVTISDYIAREALDVPIPGWE